MHIPLTKKKVKNAWIYSTQKVQRSGKLVIRSDTKGDTIKLSLKARDRKGSHNYFLVKLVFIVHGKRKKNRKTSQHTNKVHLATVNEQTEVHLYITAVSYR